MLQALSYQLARSADSAYSTVADIHLCLQLVDLSAAQDVEAGDGTTTVVVFCGSMLSAAQKMLN